MTDREVCGRCKRELPSGSLEKDFGGICPHCLGALLAREEVQGPSWASGALTPFDINHAPLAAGDIFRSMQILQIVARGGMGYVYRARQTPLNRIVALKILAPELAASEAFRARFDREAKILAALNHPNIVQVFDFGREGELLFLSMEHVEGTDLQTIFDKDERLDRLRLLNIVRDVARGLRCIHESGLVHRDIKPANLLITASGQAKIADFGIAIEAQETERLTETGTFIGSPHYVSPEHVQAKRVDGRSDLYSLGCILFQGLSGRPPFSAPSPSALLLKHVQEAPPAIWKSAPDLPPALGDLLRRLLAKNPAARPDSARTLERDLDRIIQGLSAWQSIEEPPKPAGLPPPGAVSGHRSPRWLLAVGGALLLGVLLPLLLFLGKGEPEAAPQAPTAASGRTPPSGSMPAKDDRPAVDPPKLDRDRESLEAPRSQAAPVPKEAAPRNPSPEAELQSLSPPERRRRLEFFASIINLSGVAASYSDLKSMTEEAVWMRRTMLRTQEKIQALVEVMKREGQNAAVDDTIRPADKLVAFDGQDLEKIGKEQAIALLGTFVAKVKAGSRTRVTVQREGAVEEFVIRFDERPKDLLNIVQIVGLIPGQEVQAATPAPAVPAPAARTTAPAPESTSPAPAPANPNPPAAAPAVLKRVSAPEGLPLKEAERLIREVFKDDYARKTNLDKLALAKKLLKHGIEAKESGADTFILLRESRDLSGQCGDPETALKAIEETARRFEINESEVKFATLASISRSARSTEEFAALARAYVRFTDDTIAREEYDIAERSATAGGQAARKGKEVPLIARLDARARECAELKIRSEKNRRAREAIAKNPDDAEARNTLGQYLCLVRGDWDGGLEDLAKGSVSDLKAAAKKDLAKPAEPVEQVGVGDLWWELSEKEKGKSQENLRRRSLFWYDLALPHLTGILQAKVQQRLSAAGLAGLAMNLFGHWKLDEGEGQVIVDSSGNGRNGRIDGARWVKGPQGTALYFDGDQSRVHLDAGAISPPWTAALWVKREASPNVASEITDSRDYTGTSLRLEQSPNTHRVGITKYGATDSVFEYQAPEGSWVYLVWVGTEKGVTLYANGGLIGTVNQVVPLHLDKLGSHESHSMKGYLDDLRVYSRALGAAEVEKLVQYGKH